MKILVVLCFSLAFALVRSQGILQIESDQGFSLGKSLGDEPESFVSLYQGISEPFDNQNLPWRLPRDVTPIHYDVTITPIIHNDTTFPNQQWEAPGEVTIRVQVNTTTNRIFLHSVNITINENTITDVSTGTNIDISQNITEAYDFYVLETVQPLEAGKMYNIYINFISLVKDGLDGLYRSSYFDPISQTTKWIATTQMEALHARQMFPCFDEPAFKATFQMKVGRRVGDISLSTTEITNTEPMVGYPDYEWDEFGRTVVMPTYLLALIVSEFAYTQANGTIYPKRVRTYAPQHHIDRDAGHYAADKAEELLRYFQDYYVHEYPLSKMDSAAVPDFFFGAMENYGLNIYRETALLYFPDESTEAERYTVTRILAHELVHQWFGNMVSPAWWTHIWLNEGFATYCAAQGTHEVAPEFQAWERFQNDAVQRSMEYDARPDYSHSVKIDEETWAEHDAMFWFDRIAYEKAGSLILMMEGFLTEATLKPALISYLGNFAFDVAIQDNLFEELNNVAKEDGRIPDHLTMKEIMDTWTLQPGFPLLRVSAEPDGVLISQERFLNNEILDSASYVNQDGPFSWHIPMRFGSMSQPNPQDVQWLEKDVAMQHFPANSAQWFLVNNGATGYYRVLYDTTLTDLLKDQLKSNHSVIHPRSRSQLLDDYFKSAWEKYITIENALSLAEFIGNDDEVIVWNTVLENLRKPFNLLSSGGSFYQSLREFLLPRLKSAINLAGGISHPLPETSGGMEVIRHLQWMDWLCALEDPECLTFAVSQVEAWQANPGSSLTQRDIRPVVYCGAVLAGDQSIFDFMYDRYTNGTFTEKQTGTMRNALACTKEVSNINGLLDGVLQLNYYNSKADARQTMINLAKTPVARSLLLRFLRSSTTEIIADPDLGEDAIINTLTTFGTYVSSTTELADINGYLELYPELVTTAVNATLDTIQGNIDWVNEFAADMASFFDTA